VATRWVGLVTVVAVWVTVEKALLGGQRIARVSVLG
jgi:hypothetical protein